MRSLSDFQESFYNAVVKAPPGAAEALGVRDVAGVNPETRLAVYQDAYWIRLTQSLEEDFDGVLELLGSHDFEIAARAYLTSYPSRSAGLMDLGLNFPKFISECAAYRDVPGLADAARSDWADFYAINAERLPVGDLSGLLALDPEAQMAARLRFQSGLNFVSLSGEAHAVFRGVDGLERWTLSLPEAQILKRLGDGSTLGEALNFWTENGNDPGLLFALLGRCASQGMVVGIC